jgi:glycosyltransferase involved in cell wall biosynthesis
MNPNDAGVRVAVLAGSAHLAPSQHRLLDALRQGAPAGFGVDLPGDGVAVGPCHDLIHTLGGHGHGHGHEREHKQRGRGHGLAAADRTRSREVAALAREHWIGLVASYPSVPHELAPSDCRLILSPSCAADADLLRHGARPQQLWRWQPGVDRECFGPGHYRADILPRQDGQINVLHVGIPQSPALLEEAFAIAARQEPRLRLVMADVDGDLPALYASADLLAHLSTSPEFPLEIIEAQASGLPVLALDAGAVPELIEDGRNGVLVPPTPHPLAEALISLARRATLRERLTVGGLNAVRGRSWERSLAELTAAWTAALAPAGTQLVRAA